MTWQEWLEKNQYDVDFGNDTIDLMKQALNRTTTQLAFSQKRKTQN